MRFCSVWKPENAREFLCTVDAAGDVSPVGDFREVTELVRASRDVGSLSEAARSAGVGEPLASWAQLEAVDPDPRQVHLVAPVRPAEVWAAGVTYERSRDARIHESKERTVYERVYEADRPELFLKATGPRVVGPNAAVGLRGDSTWQVPEPEIGLILGLSGTVLGYTLGNDMSSRDIEGENPLYLPQAKIFSGSCALGPLVVSEDEVADPYDLRIHLRIERGPELVFDAETSTARLHARFEQLVHYLSRDNPLPPGVVLLTGTGIVPDDTIRLQAGDAVEISCPDIGVLRNRCVPASEVAAPAGWY